MTTFAPSCAVRVRLLAHTDFPAWQDLWLGYNAFYGRSGPTALPHDVTLTTWSRLFDAYEPMHALVAELDGKLVGLAQFLYHRSTIQSGPSCYLEDLFTSEGVRGQGIGRKLVEAVYAAARCAGAPQVYWHTHETNATAMQLYDDIAEQSGFLHYTKTLSSSG
jgi:GNAT superfamily N-acetyltransferase